MNPILPYSAFLGFTAARRALLCTLVDPLLCGVAISGPVGTGKSALMRSFGALIHQHIDPAMPFVEVPLGVTEDRLLGGVDLEASIVDGRVRSRQGLISSAHGGYLFVDDLPLLDRNAAASVMRALERGELTVEREGVTGGQRSRFVLLATAVPSERELTLDVVDRVAFLIGAERISRDSAHLLMTRLETLRRAPEEIQRLHSPLDSALAVTVSGARARLDAVQVGSDVVASVVERADALGVIGHRAEILAVKAARAHAALRGASAVAEEDVVFADVTVLVPRAQRMPSEDPGPKPRRPTLPPAEDAGDEDGRVGDNARRVSHRHASDNAPETPGADGARDPAADNATDERSCDDVDVPTPVEFAQALAPVASFFSRRPGGERGKDGLHAQWQRGRHVQSVRVDPKGRRIAIAATLREAAPHQQRRRRDDDGARVIVRGQDLRVKRFTERAGTLYVFCVDASGSMARNRIREAKGTIVQLLHEAYINRDTVALIAFRGARAEVLLPPTGSVERARRSIEVLPTGGGTPLASALVQAYGIVELARRRDVAQSVVVLLTDGRANVPLASNAATVIREVRRRQVRADLETIGIAYRRAGVRTLVVDTSHASGPDSEAARLAEVLGGRYYHLPTLDANELTRVIKS